MELGQNRFKETLAIFCNQCTEKHNPFCFLLETQSLLRVATFVCVFFACAHFKSLKQHFTSVDCDRKNCQRNNGL